MLASTMARQRQAGVTKMNQKSYKVFADLCESVLLEASTSLDLVRGHPGGPEVIKYLHKNRGLSHEQSYKSIPKISWNELKDNWGGAWVIVVGDKGTGAIKASRGSYSAIAFDGTEVRTFNNDRGGNILDFLKGIIGKTTSLHVGKETGSVGQLQNKRREQQAGAGPQEVSRETLLAKFKPLWIKAIRAAQADIKGMVANMVKNDAYEKAKQKISVLENLEDAADRIETGDTDTPGFLNTAIKNAIIMSASHYYPDQTGEISKERYGGRGLMSASSEGQRMLLSDISKGDQKKLGTVLAFFKRSLITG